MYHTDWVGRSVFLGSPDGNAVEQLLYEEVPRVPTCPSFIHVYLRPATGDFVWSAGIAYRRRRKLGNVALSDATDATADSEMAVGGQSSCVLPAAH